MSTCRLAVAAFLIALVPHRMMLTCAAAPVPVYVSGEDGYHTFRIPAIIATKKGTLLAFCEGRKAGRGDAGDIDLLLKRSSDGGKTWSRQAVIWDDASNTCGNPCPVVDEATGTIWLLLTWNRGDDPESTIKAGTSNDTRRVFVSNSTDDGATWAKPADITTSAKVKDWLWYATGPGVGIQMREGRHKGRMVIPCDHSVAGGAFHSHSIHSDDGGKTWVLGGAIRPDVNECQAVELPGGRLMMNLRNYSKEKPRRRAIAYSDDGGASWGEVTYDDVLVEPICQASLIRLYGAEAATKAGTLVFLNPGSAKREAMTLRTSIDGGKTWRASSVLFKGHAAYSGMVELPGGVVGCFYECGGKHPYERIVFERVRIDSSGGISRLDPVTPPN